MAPTGLDPSRSTCAQVCASAPSRVRVLEIGAAREFSRSPAAGTGRIHARQRGVEQRHRFRLKDLLNEGHDLRPDRLAAIEKQNAAAQFVELLDLRPLPRLRPCLALHARGEPAHGQRGYLEGGQRDPVLRIRNPPGEHRRDKEVVEAIDRDQRRNAGFPKAPDDRNHHHNQEVERAGCGEVQMQPERDERHQRDSRQPGEASAQNSKSRLHGLPVACPAIRPGPGVRFGDERRPRLQFFRPWLSPKGDNGHLHYARYRRGKAPEFFLPRH